MYSKEDFLGAQCDPTRVDIRKLQNEKAISNLFQAVSNPEIFGRLDSSTQRQLCELLADYTCISIDKALTSGNTDISLIREIS